MSIRNKLLRRRTVAVAGAAAVAAALSLLPLASSHAATTARSSETKTGQAAAPDAAPPVLTFKTTGRKVTIGGTKKSGNDQNNIDGIGQIVLSAQANKGTSFAYLNLTPARTSRSTSRGAGFRR